MTTFIRTLVLALPLFTFALPATAQKPRKVGAAVAVSAAPVARVTVAQPEPAVAAPAARVAVAVPAPVIAVAAPPPRVTVMAPMATLQVQVSGEGGYVEAAPMPVGEVPMQAAPSCSVRQEGELQGVIAAIKSESFSSNQLRVLADASQGSCYFVAQVEQIIPLFSFEADQLKALQIMAPRIVDRQNNFRIYGLFTFDSGKQQARHILSR